jgi:signal transduction histidine kinase
MKLVAPVFLNYGMQEGLSSYAILCMLPDHQENLWFGYWNGLDRLQPDGRITSWDETDGLYHHTIKSMAADESGNIWIGTELGLNLFRSERIIKKNIVGFPKQSQIWSMLRDPEAGIWLGLKGTIVQLIQGQIQIMLGQSAGLPDDVIAPVFIDHQKRLWFGTETYGAGIFQNNTLMMLNRENGLPDNYIHCFFQDEPDRIWIGTNRGLTIWQNGRFKKLPFSEALIEHGPVYFVLRDSLQHLWFGTDYGLYEWTGTILHHFNTRDGLASDIVTCGSVKADGALWFGTQDGVSCLKPANRLVRIPVPAVYFDQIVAGDAERPISNYSVVGYPDRSIVFNFNALSFIDEKAIQFEWRLTGFDKSWIGPFPQRRIRYTNLGAGEYTFQVRAANRNGDWSVPAKFNFRVRPPYWETWWFITLVILFLSALLLLIYRYRMNQIRKIENMRSRIAADLHDDIASSLASVALYSEVIQRQLQPDSEAMRSLLNRISDLSREVMENIGIIVWAVDPRQDELNELLTYFQRHARQLCTTAGVSFLSQLPAELKPIILSPEQRRSIYLILKEGLNNVLRHAHCSQVIFACAYQDRILELSLQDNGHGFDLKSVTGGHGLENMTLRAQKIQADIQIVSQPGKGSAIHLRLRMT